MPHPSLPAQPCEDDWELDPQFLQSRREVLVVLLLFLGCFAWTIGVSYWLGYRTMPMDETGNVPLVWGMPVWVFWGVLMPWIVVDLLAVWFCFGYMQDEPTANTELATVSLARDQSDDRLETPGNGQ